MYQKIMFYVSGPTSGGGEAFWEELKLKMLPKGTGGFVKCPRCDSSVLLKRVSRDSEIFEGSCSECKAEFINQM